MGNIILPKKFNKVLNEEDFYQGIVKEATYEFGDILLLKKTI